MVSATQGRSIIRLSCRPSQTVADPSQAKAATSGCWAERRIHTALAPAQSTTHGSPDSRASGSDSTPDHAHIHHKKSGGCA